MGCDVLVWCYCSQICWQYRAISLTTIKHTRSHWNARLSFNLLHPDCFAGFMDKIRLMLKTRIRSCTFMVFFLIVHVTLHKDSIFFPFRALTNSFHSHMTTKRSGLMTGNYAHQTKNICTITKLSKVDVFGARHTHTHVTFTHWLVVAMSQRRQQIVIC